MNTTETTLNPSQEAFNKAFIGVAEISQMVGVTRVSVYKASEAGRLPNPITNCCGIKVLLWERAPLLPHLDAWRLQREQKRAERGV